MSKLLKLKDWLTLDDAAKQLTIMFGEPVSKADILRLALDGVLILSINFVNGAKARCGPLVSGEQTKYLDFPIDFKATSASKAPGKHREGFRKIPKGVPLNSGEVIEIQTS